MSDGPSDGQLLRLLEPAVKIERAPYEYATSFPLELVVAHFEDGTTREFIVKDLNWTLLLPEARQSKPAFLYSAQREIDTYRRVLPAVGAGPAFIGGDGTWFLIDKAPGVELWQIGDLDVWQAVAEWLAAFHTRGARVDALALNPQLLHYTPEHLSMWPARAVAATRNDRLRAIAHCYDDVIEQLCSIPASFIHGELYPSNVMVASTPEVRVWPVDWEMAAVGPPLLDVVALTSGWADKDRVRLVDAYVVAAGDAPWITDDLERVLDSCRLHYAMQWLGWSSTWTPPREHARDWLQEALDAADRLGL